MDPGETRQVQAQTIDKVTVPTVTNAKAQCTTESQVRLSRVGAFSGSRAGGGLPVCSLPSGPFLSTAGMEAVALSSCHAHSHQAVKLEVNLQDGRAVCV